MEGNISIFESKPEFDTILYIDVLEHIENDSIELEMAASRLHKHGKLIILSPAFPALYSHFDKAIGHHRRYTKNEMNALMPQSMSKILLRYLDGSGFFLSFANRLLLKQMYPTLKQIKFWDKYLVPVSIISDRIFNYSFGKSILGIWEKNN
jgi:2-polyprenyl-3-methyl-5-hydroxy-6-metoxy-1,4-benzoquinol methylase